MADATENAGVKRERSARYPAVPLADAVEFCRQIDGLGIDGLTAPQIATAMGYKNVKTNTFSGRLSSARQFGLIDLADQNYTLTELVLRIIHPFDPEEVPKLLRQACQLPPLFAELMKHYAGKRLPEPEILGNLLMHRHQITASAKMAAAESFYASIQHAGLLDETRVLDAQANQPSGHASASEIRATALSKPQLAISPVVLKPPEVETNLGLVRSTLKSAKSHDEVRLDLTLWDEDQGKQIRLRAPSTMTQASLDRFIQSLKLAIRVRDQNIIQV
ncbi:MAG: hypothetical protein NT172_13870 [Planctomycetota bacterium]|nr:hypothetical protein [Planctomycetota bacterium]